MKTCESGMPPEEMWVQYFDPPAILRKLGLTSGCHNLLEFGCGYGTFTLAAAQIISGTVHALDIDEEMLQATKRKCVAANVKNVNVLRRDFAMQGSGLGDGSIDYVMLFNILHAAERLTLLNEARRVLSSDGKLAIIHWNYDAGTPRGPSMAIRPRPEDCRRWAAESGFREVLPGRIDLPPYHYGYVFKGGF